LSRRHLRQFVLAGDAARAHVSLGDTSEHRMILQNALTGLRELIRALAGSTKSIEVASQELGARAVDILATEDREKIAERSSPAT